MARLTLCALRPIHWAVDWAIDLTRDNPAKDDVGVDGVRLPARENLVRLLWDLQVAGRIREGGQTSGAELVRSLQDPSST